MTDHSLNVRHLMTHTLREEFNATDTVVSVNYDKPHLRKAWTLIMSDALLRQHIILHNLPHYPSKITTRELLDALAAEGITTTMRTVQRDLESLSTGGIFGISADKNSKPAGWYWLKQARKLQIPYMDISTAIAFSLIESESESIMPSSIRDQISPYFRQSNELLRNRNDWSSKISRFSRTQYKPDSIDERSKEIIYKALDEGKCISAKIARLIEGPNLRHIEYSKMHPVGLRIEQHDIYVVAHLGKPNKVMLYALCRFSDVKLLSSDADTSRVDELDADCHSRLNVTFKQSIKLEIEFSNSLLNKIYFNPFSEDQKISKITNNLYQLTATVNDDIILRHRLLSLGSKAKIIKPESMAAVVRQEAIKLLERYDQEIKPTSKVTPKPAIS